jgi:CDP-glucose 4,6-dehydratase
VRAVLAGEPLRVRNPEAIRPWQHVLNPLGGYLVLAQALWESDEYAVPWNFGPPEDEARSVGWIVERVRELWDGEPSWELDGSGQPQEAYALRVDSSRARARLGWRPVWGLAEALERTVAWFRAYAEGVDVRDTTSAEVEAFAAAQALGVGSTGS